ncbi:hypothetical protein AB0D08_02615 [Kitasatospora sp. NPDC048540]|uniref:hypothetical protein n=1 Tax=Kitasatospora sp. NPDC048540 TaxID=3155634 RepID=UPI00340ED396
MPPADAQHTPPPDPADPTDLADPTDPGAAPLFGEPFDSGLAQFEDLQLAADLAAALAVLRRLLAAAEALDDSPDVRFLRAHLLANSAIVRLSASDLPYADDDFIGSLDLLRSIEAAPMGPRGRQLWLDVLLKTLLGRAELLRRSGRLDEAAGCLDEADARLPGFAGDGTRAAELGHHRVLLLMARSEWGAAEELALAVLDTTPAEVETRPRLFTALGLACASTGRFDPAEDWFTRAEEGFALLGDVGARQELIADRAYTAMRRGDFDTAERLFAEASAVFEQQRRFGDLAVCEQARGFLAAQRGDAAGARALVETGLARFQRLGASLAAADTMLLAARQAYARGDLDEQRRLTEGAREVYQAQGVYERCAQADLMLAASIEGSLDRLPGADPAATADAAADSAPTADAPTGDRAAALDAALALAVPAALAVEAFRFDFATGHARSQWLELAQEGMRLVFRLAQLRGDQGLLFELVEHRCAGAALTLDRVQGGTATAAFPDPAAKVRAPAAVPGSPASPLGAVAAEAAASVGLRAAPPPPVLMSPASPRTALQEYAQAARTRYHRAVVSGPAVASW